jgi:hypothetical protein
LSINYLMKATKENRFQVDYSPDAFLAESVKS